MLLRIYKKAVVKTTEITEQIIASPSELAFFGSSRSLAGPEIRAAAPRRARSRPKPKLALPGPDADV
jgi:hypothetical protein